MTREMIIRTLAKAFAVSDFTESDLIRCARIVSPGRTPRWMKLLAQELEEAFCEKPRPRQREIEAEIGNSAAFLHALELKKRPSVVVAHLLDVPAPKMHPASPSLRNCGLPPLLDFQETAKLLELHPDDLGWLTEKSYRKTDHYHYRWHPKRSGNGKRLIEIPKPLLKQTQHFLLSELLERIPPHDSAVGFQQGKSIFDFVTPHCRKRIVLKLDLEDFFPGIRAARVIRVFMTAGYPERVAILLAALTTHATAADSARESGLEANAVRRLLKPHLPQGAPTSPALANLCAFRLDCRLSGLARSAGADYTRYADDLLFSGDDHFRRKARSFYFAALGIIIEEGFQANLRKTRFMHASQRQHAGGLVLNEKPNVTRRDYDQLKAILKNCVKTGPDSQNHSAHPDFKNHLRGRIGWVGSSNPRRAEKLTAVFNQIPWQGEGI